jgi:hypothetical protein
MNEIRQPREIAKQPEKNGNRNLEECDAFSSQTTIYFALYLPVIPGLLD